jgi:tetratricopeptide (TPR) repeat protein
MLVSNLRFSRAYSLFMALALAAVPMTLCCHSIAPAGAKGHGKSTAEPEEENMEEGKRRYKAKELDGAVDSFLQAIYFSRNGYCPSGYFWLGLTYYDKGGLDQKAIDALDKCVTQSLKFEPDAHYLLAKLYVRTQRLPEASTEAGKMLNQAPNNSERARAYNLLGDVAVAQGNLQEASSYYMDALGDRPWKYTEAWVNYGEVLMKQKSYEAAFAQFRNLLESPVGLKNVPFDRVYNDVGLCMFTKGDHQGALDNWRKALQYNPENAAVHLQIALCFDKERHISSAIQEYKEYIRLASDTDPKNTSKVQDRVTVLEQKLAPVPVPVVQRQPQVPTMTPEEIEAEKRQLEKEKETLNPIVPQKGDSGF